MLNSDENASDGTDVCRRTFLVTLGGVVLGSFVLPSSTSEGGLASESAVEQATRNLLTKPTRRRIDDQRFLLVWMEQRDGESVPMIWQPETAQEVADAERFYNAARGYDPSRPRRGKRKGLLARVGESLGLVGRSQEEKRLLRAILDHPQDDTVALAYADWLAARGNSMGEFIRLSIELERMSESDPKRRGLDERWSELLDQDARTWFKPLADLGLEPSFWGQFAPYLCIDDRGMIVRVDIDKPGILPEQAEALFEAVPLLREIEFSFDSVDVPRICALPQMDQITSLGLSNVRLQSQDILALVASTHFTSLRKLDIGFNRLRQESVAALASSGLVSRLTALDLGACDLGNDEIRLLTHSAQITKLQELDLGTNCFDAAGLRALAQSANLVQLASLTLSSNKLGAEGLGALSGAAWLPRLSSLDLDSCELTPTSVIALVALPLERLERLNLANNEVGAGGAEALAVSSSLPNLRELKLAGCGLGDTGVRALIESSHVGKLQRLDLEHNGLTAQGARDLASCQRLVSLRKLELYGNDIGTDGSLALAQSTSLKKLKSLSVAAETVGDKGAQALKEAFGDDVVSIY